MLIGGDADDAGAALDMSGNVVGHQLYAPHGGMRYSSGVMPPTKGMTSVAHIEAEPVSLNYGLRAGSAEIRNRRLLPVMEQEHERKSVQGA
jgi:hypothetical protein